MPKISRLVTTHAVCAKSSNVVHPPVVVGHQFITRTVNICVQHGGPEAPRRLGLSAAAETNLTSFSVMNRQTINNRISNRIVYCLQSFLRDAEQLESLTASDEAFLDFDDLGVSVCVFHFCSDAIRVCNF